VLGEDVGGTWQSGRASPLQLESWERNGGAVLSGYVDDMFESGRAPPLQPTFSYRRWEGSGVALRRCLDDTW
jgi:hypothetical protein